MGRIGKNMVALFIFLSSLAAIASCHGKHDSGQPTIQNEDQQSTADEQITPVVPATTGFESAGGNGAAGTGGNGASLRVAATGTVSLLTTGTVDAGFVLPNTREFGYNPVVLSNGTYTVQLDEDKIPGQLYMKSGGLGLIYLGNGDNVLDETEITGLTVQADAVLVLNGMNNHSFHGEVWTGYAVLDLDQYDLLIEGTIIANPDITNGKGLAISAHRIEIANQGKILAPGKEIHLTSRTGRTIVNRGVIQSKGMTGGNGGLIALNADELVINTGTIDSSGGNSDSGTGGTGGDIDVNVFYGNFYSSGAIFLNGGNGTTGGKAGSAQIQTLPAPPDTQTTMTVPLSGDIILSGKWEANGGSGANGNGGDRGSLSFVSNAMGAIALDADLSARGGNGSGSASANGGGGTGGIAIISRNSHTGSTSMPGKVRVTGKFNINGGNGAQNGGDAGEFRIEALGGNASFKGTDVEVILPELTMNGGSGALKGGDANKLEVFTFAPQDGDVDSAVTGTNRNTDSVSAGPIVTQIKIQAKGGAGGTAGTGGSGGIGLFEANNTSLFNSPSISGTTTVITNSATLDFSGGDGKFGGNAQNVTMKAVKLTNTGTIACKGGAGSPQDSGTGGKGGTVSLTSTGGGTAKGTIDVSGGTGATNGANGTITVDGVTTP